MNINNLFNINFVLIIVLIIIIYLFNSNYTEHFFRPCFPKCSPIEYCDYENGRCKLYNIFNRKRKNK